jgi:PleD family two-component response regulator
LLQAALGGCATSPVRPSYTFPVKSIEILVIDDEPKIRRIITSYLQEERFDTTEASDGETALELASSTPILRFSLQSFPVSTGSRCFIRFVPAQTYR